MTSTTHDAKGETGVDLQAIMKDIVALQNDFAALAGHFKTSSLNGAGDAARAAAGQFGDQAAQAYDSVAAQSDRSAKAVIKQIEERPVVSLLLAFCLGVVGARLLAR